jgi:hypothetical protein
VHTGPLHRIPQNSLVPVVDDRVAARIIGSDDSGASASEWVDDDCHRLFVLYVRVCVCMCVSEFYLWNCMQDSVRAW